MNKNDTLWTARWQTKKTPYLQGKVSVCLGCNHQIQSLGGQMDFCPYCGKAMTARGRHILTQRLKEHETRKESNHVQQ